jgi:hypothetical protein
MSETLKLKNNFAKFQMLMCVGEFSYSKHEHKTGFLVLYIK